MRPIISILFFLLGLTLNAQFVRTHGTLQVQGTQLVDQNNEAVVLRGMSLGWHSLWPRFYNESVVDWLKTDFKSTVVRAAMGIEFGKDAYKDNPKEAQKRIEAVIKGAIKSDIYVIVDWHSHNVNLAEAKRFFEAISKKYGQYPNVIYEIFNEPDQESWEEVKAYSEEIIAVIRKNDPDNIILVGSPHWDQDVNLVADNPILNQKNIMYTLHFYAATHKQELRNKAEYALQKGVPIFVSESAGMEASGDGNLDIDSWKTWIDWMEARKISWVTWSVSDKKETCSILKKSASSTGNWKDADLNDSGVLIRPFLRDFNFKKE